MVIREEVFAHWSRGNEYPRELGLSREYISSYTDLKAKWKDVDEYASIFSLKQIFYEEYDTIFFDIDGKSGGISESYDKYKKVMNEIGDYVTRIYYSGVGIHLYIDLENKIVGRENYKNICEQFINDHNLMPYIDRGRTGNARQIARLPESVNSRSGYMMILVERDDDMTRMRFKSTVGQSKYEDKVDRVKLEIKSTAQPIVKKTFEDDETYNWRGAYPACIVNAEKYLEELGELNHEERIHLATFLLNIGREDELREYLKKANDYKESLTNYQINYLKERHMKSYTCANIPTDLCPFLGNKRLCLFYPSVNVVQERFGKRKSGDNAIKASN